MNFKVNNSWELVTAGNISLDDPTVKSLLSGFKERAGLEIHSTVSKESDKKRKQIIRLTIKPESVQPVDAADKNLSEISEQAYHLELNASEVVISANAPQGLFYGVQTLLQLLRTEKKMTLLPEGEITDWPDLELRMIYWDCAHHLERMEAFKHAVRQAAYFKINAIALKLEGHFEFKSAEPVVEPYALSPSEYQELTDYAATQFVQLTPYLDAPAHVSFILKHPEYASLRTFPDVNYEFSVTDPKADELITGMFNDLLNANRGGRYVHLSTDEAYYVGKSDNEKKVADTLGGNGRLLADFIARISGRLNEKGRKVIFWGEYPLTAADIDALPPHLINGEYNDSWASAFKDRGIRQLIYTSTQGVEPLFPNYYTHTDRTSLIVRDTAGRSDDEQQQPDASKGRIGELLRTIQTSVAAGKSDLMGIIVAAWGDAGLHPETFWLGYAAGSAAAWNLKNANPDELSDRFYSAFYGTRAVRINRVYQLLSTQAQYWNDSWDIIPSQLRTPVLGNSKGLYDKPKPARDQSLPVLPVPSGKDLSADKDWSTENSVRLQAAEMFLKENNELNELLLENLKITDHQYHNLEIMLTITRLCRQNIEMLLYLREMNDLLLLASKTATQDPAKAISYIDKALDMVNIIRISRNETLKSLTDLWYQDWYPRVKEANGRTYLDQVDDIKDHLPVRTVDMSYLIYREIHFPLGNWADAVRTSRNQFAYENRLSLRLDTVYWENYHDIEK